MELWSEPLPNTSYNAVLSDSIASPLNSRMLYNRQSEKNNFWPKRVISIGNPNKLILVEGQLYREDYLVLSYCWGPLIDQEKKRFYTTSENYEARKRGFNYDELPKTFQDAVQGPDGDWDSEATTIADIFACAYYTIAASSPLFILTYIYDFEKDVDKGPLIKRAWLIKLEPPFGKQYFILDPNFPHRLQQSRFTCTVDFVQFLFRKYSISGLTVKTNRDIAIYSLVEHIGQVLRTKDLLIPRFEDLGFANDGQTLSIEARKFRGNCRMEEKGEEYIIFNGTEKVGSLYMVKDNKEDPRKTYYVLMIREKAGSRGYKRIGVEKVEAQYMSIDCEARML
ncbi:uncharacterized protein B0T15DRAFT_486331 [Chaetomium strumarium]|uniref:Heterokaryon incompatibility domain-containing protein n=1 Tax=Chaetomium strumarium TaxID=1170767 RepID=A0AAJ0M0U8_9PEZI|nr:hypothetical protein B0T15DRAFT_486331 [Chaetomium strumarium]